jgi:hypothetical protein
MSEREFEVMVEGEDGWADWIHPLPGYRMRCCDCGLVHDMEFSIVPNEINETTLNPGETDAGLIIFRARRSEATDGL